MYMYICMLCMLCYVCMLYMYVYMCIYICMLYKVDSEWELNSWRDSLVA